MPASPDVQEAALLGQWSRLLFATLQAAGVRDVWVSPGSRSTPFAWTALRTAGLTVRPVVDERAAAFMALGQARVTGRPGVLLCTSGSAAANYFPAIVEAAQAHLPVIVLTADRPLEVQHAGAAQTIDQLKMYGDYVRAFYELGLPDAHPGALRGLRRTLALAVAHARGPLPGPVHLNARARKPLEPLADAAPSDLVREADALLAQPLARFCQPQRRIIPEAIQATIETVQRARAGAIVVGPLALGADTLAPQIGELARLTGFPILAEATSQVRFGLAGHPLACPQFDWLLHAERLRRQLCPEVLVCIGATPTSSGFERWALEHRTPRIVWCEHGAPDALGTATIVASGDLGDALDSLIAGLTRSRGNEPAKRSTFADALLAAAHRCASATTRALERTDGLGEGAAVRAIVEALPGDALLMLGNSLPIRDVDAYVTRARCAGVLCQRGANGIDGQIAGAIGSALASGAPTLLLLGDVSLFHDLGALQAVDLLSTPLVVAVIDNDGGRIFDQLPVRSLYEGADDCARFWRTPPRRDLSQVAALFGMRYAAPHSTADIASATRDALGASAATLLHVRVSAHSAYAVRRQVLDALADPVLDAA